MTRTRWIFAVLSLTGIVVLAGVAVATPFDVGLYSAAALEVEHPDLVGRSVSAAGPATSIGTGWTMDDLLNWQVGSTRESDPSSAALLGLGLLGLTILSGRKFDVPTSTDTQTQVASSSTHE